VEESQMNSETALETISALIFPCLDCSKLSH
jgi:hypothetical protein